MPIDASWARYTIRSCCVQIRVKHIQHFTSYNVKWAHVMWRDTVWAQARKLARTGSLTVLQCTKKMMARSYSSNRYTLDTLYRVYDIQPTRSEDSAHKRISYTAPTVHTEPTPGPQIIPKADHQSTRSQKSETEDRFELSPLGNWFERVVQVQAVISRRECVGISILMG
jgi:hypothetical protein